MTNIEPPEGAETAEVVAMLDADGNETTADKATLIETVETAPDGAELRTYFAPAPTT
jgi:hypothetical protein